MATAEVISIQATETATKLDIVVNRKELVSELAAAVGVVETKTTIPILANLLLDASKPGDAVRIARGSVALPPARERARLAARAAAFAAGGHADRVGDAGDPRRPQLQRGPAVAELAGFAVAPAEPVVTGNQARIPATAPADPVGCG